MADTAAEHKITGRAEHDASAKGKKAWNAGRKPGATRVLKPKKVWANRFWLNKKERSRDRIKIDLAIDIKLRG